MLEIDPLTIHVDNMNYLLDLNEGNEPIVCHHAEQAQPLARSWLLIRSGMKDESKEGCHALRALLARGEQTTVLGGSRV